MIPRVMSACLCVILLGSLGCGATDEIRYFFAKPYQAHSENFPLQDLEVIAVDVKDSSWMRHLSPEETVRDTAKTRISHLGYHSIDAELSKIYEVWDYNHNRVTVESDAGAGSGARIDAVMILEILTLKVDRHYNEETKETSHETYATVRARLVDLVSFRRVLISEFTYSEEHEGTEPDFKVLVRATRKAVDALPERES